MREVIGEHAAELGERGPLRLLEHVQEGASLVDDQREQGDAPVESAGDPAGEHAGGAQQCSSR